MFRLSRWLALAGSLLIAAGALLLGGLALLPEQTPALQVTPDLSHIITPTFAYLGTPLQPPSASNAGAVLILPEMPVAASETPAPSDTITATPTETVTASPTMTESPSPAPTSPTATLQVAMTSPGATRPAHTASPTPSASPTDTPTLTATPSPTNSATPTATLTATATLTPTPTLTPPPSAPERIIIPAIEVDAPVEPVGWHSVEVDGQLYGQWDVPPGYAAGWHNTSAPPGQSGNTVLNGHHNVNGRVFGALIDLQPGDDITLVAGGRSFAYVVVQSMVLQERYVSLEDRLANAQWILPSNDERLTLVSCWPENDNSHRLIVVALPRSALPPGVFDDLLP